MNCVYLIKDFNYAIIKIENHQLSSSVNDQNIKINIMNEIDNMIGNMPINSIKKVKKFIFIMN